MLSFNFNFIQLYSMRAQVMADTNALPKKVVPRELKPRQKCGHFKRRAASNNISKPKEIPKRTQTSNQILSDRSDHRELESKEIQTDPEPRLNIKLDRLCGDLNPKNVVRLLPQPQTKTNKQLALPLLPSRSASDKFELQDFQKQFLLRERAKRFILKIKKQKEESDKKYMELKQKSSQKKQNKLKLEMQRKRTEKELELTNKKIKLDNLLRQYDFNKERREEMRLKREEKEKESRSQLQEEISYSKQEAKNILKKRAKAKSPSLLQLSSSKSNIAQQCVKQKVMTLKKPRKIIRNSLMIQKGKSRSSTESNIDSTLQAHLYLSLQDESLLDKIKSNLQRLQSLRGDNRKNNIFNRYPSIQQ